MIRTALSLSMLVSAIACTVPWQIAAASDDHEQARQLLEQGVILPLEAIIQKLPEPVERILEVELEDEHGQRVYEIEILNSKGEVKEYVFDAQNGELLKMEHDN